MLRKSIRRVVDLSEDIQSLSEALVTCVVLAFASVSLSRLVRAQHTITDSDPRPPSAGHLRNWRDVGRFRSREELDEDDPT